MPHYLISFRGYEAPAWVLRAVGDGRVPGVCLFSYNFRDLPQFRALNESLLDAARSGGQPPPLLGVDQEGGQLMAVTGGATELPGNLALGATGSTEYAAATGRILATELRALGCNLNFAPVLDVLSRPENPVVGLRAFSDDPDLVARLGAAFIEALQEGGVLASAKHFPGHGNTTVDSHHAGASVDRSLDELLALELKPFQSAFGADLASVMTAHVHYPQLDSQPATFSRAILTGLLRARLGFEGLIVTDALDMHALAGTPEGDRARAALEAGADLPLLGHMEGQEAMVDALADSTYVDSRRRIERARARLSYDLPPLDTGEWALHRDTASAMARAAITVVHGATNLPLRLSPDARLCLVTVATGNLTPAESVVTAVNPLIAQVAWRHANTLAVEVGYGADEGAVRAAAERCRGADAVVLATVNAATDPAQRLLFERLVSMGSTPYVLALRSPADAAYFPDARSVICSYGRRSIQTEAAAAVLFGEASARGTLPLKLTGARPAHVAGPGVT
ncbi:MAG TPA: beta-N-acetylhexosaminidase [Trueperaceae bacterium]|nr:beta-N-acetylhexosaminidase [Trueperaceae bacterium]